jgi:hypothetical protein
LVPLQNILRFCSGQRRAVVTKLRDPTTAPGAFRDSIYQLPTDPDIGDGGMDRAIRESGKKERTLYGYHDPDGPGPPIAVAEIIDEIHRRNGGIEHNYRAWQERREGRMAGHDGDLVPAPAKLIGRIISDMDQATRALAAGHGDAQEILRQTAEMIDGYAALSRAIFERLDAEGAKQQRRADDRRPFRPAQATGPRLVPSVKGGAR